MDIQIKSSRSVLATDSAVKKLVELKAEESNENSFLRMGVKPGGCSGLSYEMFFDTERQQNDVFESYDGVEIGIDSQSLEHIKGSTLDYKEGLMETGFSIDNPNATRTCGCGDSFYPTECTVFIQSDLFSPNFDLSLLT